MSKLDGRSLDELTLDELQALMTERQLRWADEFLMRGNKAEAAREAGYSVHSARKSGEENGRKPIIAAYLKRRLDELREERVAKADEVLEYLSAVMRGRDANGTELMDDVALVVGMGDGMANVEHADVKVSTKDRTRAAELLGKRYGLFTDNLALTMAEPPRIVIDLPKEPRDA